MAVMMTTTVLPTVTEWLVESAMVAVNNTSVACLNMMNNNNISSSSNDSLLSTLCTPQSLPPRLAPPPMPLADVIIVSFYALICAVGLVGNGLVIAVILRYASMKTATNVYLVNLSAADLMFLVGLPLIITTASLRGWIFGHVMCKVFYALTCANTFNGSLTLAVLSGDRFLAVCFPVTSRAYRTPRAAVIVVAVSWLITAAAIYPVARFAEVVPAWRDPNLFSCTMNWPDGYKLFVVYTFVFGFFAPVGLICFFYAFLVVRLTNVRRRASSHSVGSATANGTGSGGVSKRSRASRSQRRVTFMVTVVVAVYIVCWLPYWAFQLFIVLSGITALPFPWFADLFKALTALSYANSMINPLLYAFTNEYFRKSFFKAFRCDGTDTLSPGDSVCTRTGYGGGAMSRQSRAVITDDESVYRRSSMLTSVVTRSRSTDVSMQRLLSASSNGGGLAPDSPLLLLQEQDNETDNDVQQHQYPRKASQNFLTPESAVTNGHHTKCVFRLT